MTAPAKACARSMLVVLFFGAGVCLALTSCGHRLGVLASAPTVEGQTASQARPQTKLNGAATVPVAAGSRTESELAVSDLSTGTVARIELDGTSSGTIAIHNGSTVLVQLRTSPDVTSVVVSGDAISQTALRRASNGIWRGTFQYWDGSNTRHSTSTISVLQASAQGATRRAFAVNTLHDS